MIALRTVLFLAGTAIASCHVLRNGKPCIDGHEEPARELIAIPKPPELPPISENSVPHVIKIEPQYIPELHVNPKPDQIPVAPILPSFIMPEIPTVILPHVNSNIVVEPAPNPIKTLPDCEKQPTNPIVIPDAPVLPPLTIPEIPTVVEVEPAPKPQLVECDDQINIEIPTKPIAIPDAPVLPPFVMPEITNVILPPENAEVIVELAPEPKPFQITVPEPSTETISDCETQPIIFEVSKPNPIEIPEAPVLPPLTVSEIPTVVAVEPISTPEKVECDGVDLEIPLKPIAIPEAPILPPFTMPELPTVVPASPEIVEVQPVPEQEPIGIVIPEAPAIPSKPNCEHVIEEVNSDLSLIKIPEAPILPSFTMPELPLVNIPENPVVIDVEPVSKPIDIPSPPVLPPLTVLPTVVESNQIIVENSTPDCESQPSSELIIIPEAPQLPPISEVLKPVEVVRPADFDCPPSNDIEEPIVPEVIKDHPLPSIPEAPVLPPFKEPHINVIEEITAAAVEVEPSPLVEVKPVIISQAPELPLLKIPAMQPIVVAESSKEPCADEKKSVYQQIVQPTFWAQNIIIDRVLPNMVVSEKEYAKSVGVGIKYPVITKPFFV